MGDIAAPYRPAQWGETPKALRSLPFPGFVPPSARRVSPVLTLVTPAVYFHSSPVSAGSRGDASSLLSDILSSTGSAPNTPVSRSSQALRSTGLEIWSLPPVPHASCSPSFRYSHLSPVSLPNRSIPIRHDQSYSSKQAQQSKVQLHELPRRTRSPVPPEFSKFLEDMHRGFLLNHDSTIYEGEGLFPWSFEHQNIVPLHPRSTSGMPFLFGGLCDHVEDGKKDLSSLITSAQPCLPNLFSRATTSAGISATMANARTRPFRPQRSRVGTQAFTLKSFAEATLGSGSLRKAVKLPEGEDRDEWLAVNVVDFYNQIHLLYGSITEFCSPQSCPEMKATDEFEYLWQDNDKFKKPTKMSAPEYIEHLLAWVQGNVDNEAMFPSRIGVPFPQNFQPLLRNMVKRLYRVYAHIYSHHYPVVIYLGLEPHLNTSFKHYVLFIDEHDLVTGKDFWGPLTELVADLLKSERDA